MKYLILGITGLFFGGFLVPFTSSAQTIPFYSNGNLVTDQDFHYDSTTNFLTVPHINLNGVSYVWPRNYATGTSVLTNGGGGKLTWKPTCDRSNSYNRPPQLIGKLNIATLANECIGTMIALYDEGNLVDSNPIALNFVGAGVTATRTTRGITVSIPGASAGTTPPAGSHTQIQFNKNGAFGAASEFSYDENLSALRIGNTDNNLIIGKWAAPSLQPGPAGLGQHNVILGISAGQLATTAAQNVIIGNAAAGRAGSTSHNVVIGSSAAFYLTNGAAQNVIVGESAGHFTKTGYNNVFLGRRAGYSNTSGSDNIFIGMNSGANITPGNLTNAIAIGNYTEPATSNSMMLGAGGNYAVNVSIGGDRSPDYRLDVELSDPGIVASFSNAIANCYIDPGNGGLLCSSDVRLKRDITPLQNSLDIINQIKPVHFTWNKDTNHEIQTGFIAQELEKIIPESVIEAEGNKAVSYATIIPYLVDSIQELNKKIEELEAEKKSEQLCIDDVCITRKELQQLISTVRKSRGSSKKKTIAPTNQEIIQEIPQSSFMNTLEIGKKLLGI